MGGLPEGGVPPVKTWDVPDVEDGPEDVWPVLIWIWDCFEYEFDEMLYWYSVPVVPAPVQ